MACVIVAFFICFVLPAILIMDRWWPLLTAIFTGDSKTLKWDILESGICQDKRDEWAPKPDPPKSIWSLTPEEREAEIARRREEWQGRSQSQQKGLLSILFETPPQEPYRPVPRQPQPQSRARTELDDLVDELYRELD